MSTPEQLDRSEQIPESKGTETKEDLSASIWDQIKADSLNHKDSPQPSAQKDFDDSGCLKMPSIYDKDPGFTIPDGEMPGLGPIDINDPGFAPWKSPSDNGDPGFIPDVPKGFDPLKPIDIGDPGFIPDVPKGFDPLKPIDIGDPGFIPDVPKGFDPLKPIDIGDPGFIPDVPTGFDPLKPIDIGDPGFIPDVPKGFDPLKPIDIGDPGFIPDVPKGFDPLKPIDIGDPGFIPDVPKGFDPLKPIDIGDPGFIPDVPKGFDPLKPIDIGDPGFSPRLPRDGAVEPIPLGEGGLLDRSGEDELQKTIDATFVELGRGGGTRGDFTGGARHWVTPHVDGDGNFSGVHFEHDGETIHIKMDGGKVIDGTLKDDQGHEIGKVRIVEDDKLALEKYDGTTELVRIKFGTAKDKENNDRQVVTAKDLGNYNADTGTISNKKDGYVETTSLAPGRKEVVDSKTGDIQTTTDRGDYYLKIKSTGDSMVSHSDGSGAMLKADGTIAMWGPGGQDRVTEKLSRQEQQYIKKHPDVDTREVAEIHRKFDGNQEKIDAFYKSLEKVDSAKNLTAEQKRDLRADLMHHVAAPEDIYQGTTESCNVSVVERDLAMTNPARYVDIVTSAVSDGVVKTPEGNVKVNPENLTIADSSGRDLASRIFQTAALQVEFHPTKKFENTPDGVGRLMPGEQNQGADKAVAFTGLLPGEIADVRHKLANDPKNDKVVANIADVDDLRRASVKENLPLTISVDQTSRPFKGSPPADHRPNHVVTIVGVTSDTPPKYLIQNQAGIANDMSTKESAVSEADLIRNMTGGDGKAVALVPAGKAGYKNFVVDGKPTDIDYIGVQQKKRYEDQLKT
jgi:hypothetical protein